MYRDYQTRLQTVHDGLKQKLIDNQIELMAQVTDCIRIRLRKNDEGDIESRIVEKADIVGVVFPPLKDVPYRTLDTEDGKTWKFSTKSLVAATEDENTQNYKLVMPHNKDVRVGDMIFRVFVDPEVSIPVVLGLEIVESLGTFGIHSIIQHSYNSVIYMEELPQEMLEVIIHLAKRRLKLKW